MVKNIMSFSTFLFIGMIFSINLIGMINTFTHDEYIDISLEDGYLKSISDQESRGNIDITHVPIRINSDDDVNWTEFSSRVISGFEIEGTKSIYCIYIGNCTIPFTVENCLLYQAGGKSSQSNIPKAGLVLYNTTHGIISNNTASSGYNGIYLTSSSHNIISNNTASLNTNDGIYLKTSNYNIIVNNNASTNSRYGISFELNSNNNTIMNNKVNSNTYGIGLISTKNNTLNNNSMTNCGVIISGNVPNYWTTQTIDTSNKVNGKPIYYWKDKQKGTIPDDAGQVILANCTGVYIKEQNVSEGGSGIILGFSNNNIVINNTSNSNNEYGVYLYNSGDNIIADNILSNNNIGIRLYNSSSNNLITRNTASKNYNGIVIISSNNSIITKNIVTSNEYSGIHLVESSNNIIMNNTASANTQHSISLSYSSYNFIANNTASLSYIGIYISSVSNYNTIINNKNVAGIFISISVGINITNNSMVNNGIILEGNDLTFWNTHTIMTSNTVNGKPVYYLKDQNGGRIPDGAGQVILTNCTNVKVQGQNVNNGSCGILLGFAHSNIISNNTACTNHYGIFLYKSNNNIIDNNTVSSNSKYGIYLFQSSNNIIRKNIANLNNKYYLSCGIYLRSSSNNNKLSNNMISSNTYGIYITYYYFGKSNYNKIYHNSFINNEHQAYDDSIGNQWDDGSEGNYWSDYNGKDILDDNIGDTPYNIPGGSSVDRYPLMDPGGHRKTPNNLIFIIITVILFGVVMMILMRLKKKGRETEQKTKPQPVLTQDQDETMEK